MLYNYLLLAIISLLFKMFNIRIIFRVPNKPSKRENSKYKPDLDSLTFEERSFWEGCKIYKKIECPDSINDIRYIDREYPIIPRTEDFIKIDAINNLYLVKRVVLLKDNNLSAIIVISTGFSDNYHELSIISNDNLGSRRYSLRNTEIFNS